MTAAELAQMASGCRCTCCADAIERARTDRNPLDGCNCIDYQAAEQCDCRLCQVALFWVIVATPARGLTCG